MKALIARDVSKAEMNDNDSAVAAKDKEWTRWLIILVNNIMKHQGRLNSQYGGWSFSQEGDEMHWNSKHSEVKRIWDDVSGQELDSNKFHTARGEEMQ